MIHNLAEKPFFSLQWEALNNWKPMVFIRYFGCNKDCFFCDSKYSYKPEEANIVQYTHKELIDTIKSFWCKTVLWTWGETTLFQKQIKALIKDLGKEYYHELETNWSKKLDDDIFFNQINISPKLKSSWNEEYALDILSNIEKRCDNYNFKFVCKNLITTKETDNYIKKYNIERKRIYIMPEWRDVDSQINQFIIKYCMKNDYRYCLRTHLILFWDWKGK